MRIKDTAVIITITETGSAAIIATVCKTESGLPLKINPMGIKAKLTDHSKRNQR